MASGTAGVARQLVRAHRADVVGIDLSEAMLRQGQANVRAAGLAPSGHARRGRAEQLPFPDAHFDALTFTYLLRYVADPAATIAELARVVRPGGPIASLEFAVPPNPFWRAGGGSTPGSCCPLAGWLTGGRAWYDVGRFLGPSISAHYRRYPVAWTLEAWQRAGSTDVGHRAMSLGGGLVMWGHGA